MWCTCTQFPGTASDFLVRLTRVGLYFFRRWQIVSHFSFVRRSDLGSWARRRLECSFKCFIINHDGFSKPYFHFYAKSSSPPFLEAQLDPLVDTIPTHLRNFMKTHFLLNHHLNSAQQFILLNTFKQWSGFGTWSQFIKNRSAPLSTTRLEYNEET